MNTQKGAIGILLIAAVLLIWGGIYLATRNEVGDARDDQANKVVDSNGQNNAGPEIQEKTKVLTDLEIKGATYPIGANFDGTEIQKIDVIFPPEAETARKLTGVVYIDRDGSLLTRSTVGAEGFWISDYEYTDDSKTEAIVNVTGNYGASGYDNRVFTVSKVNGKVVVKED